MLSFGAMIERRRGANAFAGSGLSVVALLFSVALVSCDSVPRFSKADATRILSESADAQKEYKSQERIFASACTFEVTSVRQEGSKAEVVVKANCGTAGRFPKEPHELFASFEYVGQWFLRSIYPRGSPS
jgi:hypothetical protein